MAKRSRNKKPRLRALRIAGWSVLIAAVLIVALPYLLALRPRPLPDGVRVRSGAWPVEPGDVALLVDATARDPVSGERIVRQEILDTLLQMISEAERVVFLDFFLWNPWQGADPESHRAVAGELADALIARKQAAPGLEVLILTDPINRIYGNSAPPFFQALSDSGIHVVFTDLDRLRDSNLIYAPPARLYGRALSRLPPVRRWLDGVQFRNPFEAGGPGITGRQMARLLFFRANHRKLAVADAGGEGWRLLVTSFNPHDGSSAHSNLGLRLAGPLAIEVLRSELECMEWSAAASATPPPGSAVTAALARVRAVLPPMSAPPASTVTVARAEWNTEGSIKDRLRQMLDGAGPGDEVRAAVFYLSDRDIVNSLKDAAYGGARVRVLLDPNRTAFGRVKDGIPNLPVAAELAEFAEAERLDLGTRWAATRGEQFHGKAISVVNRQSGRFSFLCGSANWTRRNLRDLNLEGAVYMTGCPQVTAAFAAYFDLAWENGDGLLYSAPHERPMRKGLPERLAHWRYRFQEATGLCSF